MSGWRQKWINEYDYIVKKYDSIVEKYIFLEESIDYYLEILEFSIFCLKKYNVYSYDMLICSDDFCVKENYLAEYLKLLFFSDVDSRIYISTIVQEYYDKYNWYLIIYRLIYPNYYFDLVYQLLNSYDDSIKRNIYSIVLSRNDYVDYIRLIITEINKYIKTEVELY